MTIPFWSALPAATAAAPLSVNVSPSSINQDLPNAESPWTSGSIIATASGGAGGYTYQWTWQSGGAGIVINSPTSSTTTVTASGTNTERSGILRCTVTDALTNTAIGTCSITVVFGTPI